MRILHVVPTYFPAWRHGGSVPAVHGLCKALAALSHDVTVFTTNIDGPGTLEVPQAVAVVRDGVAVWYFPVAFPRRLYRSPKLDAALKQQVAGFDVVHLHSVFLLPTRAAARAAERASVPYLVAPHGMLVGDLLNRRGRLRKRLWIHLVERRTLARAAGLHATSELEAEEVSRLGLAPTAVHVVPNGVDVEPSQRAQEDELAAPVRDALGRHPLLLFLGRLSWKKGLDRLVAALGELPGATLAIAGNDEEGYRPQLERLAADADVAPGRILYLGYVEGADKAALLHGADLLVLPSYSENFAIVVLEAMAAGLPVVVTPEVGLASEVREAGAGVVVTNDPPLLAAALRGLLSDPEERRRMGCRGAAAAQRFGWAAVAARMEEVYESVLARPRGEPRAAPAASPEIAGGEAAPVSRP